MALTHFYRSVTDLVIIKIINREQFSLSTHLNYIWIHWNIMKFMIKTIKYVIYKIQQIFFCEQIIKEETYINKIIIWLRKYTYKIKYLEDPAPSICWRSNGGSKICSRSSFESSNSANWSNSEAISMFFCLYLYLYLLSKKSMLQLLSI